jgi:hypothetical protein
MRSALSRTLGAGVKLGAALIAAGLVWPGERGPALTFLGIAAIVATPYLRVAHLGALFARRGEKAFAWLCALALGLMLLGLFLGFRASGSA